MGSNLPPVIAPTVVILAAGQGTRMRSRVPKMLHDLCGRPMIGWPIAAAREAGAGKNIVLSGPHQAPAGGLPPGVEVALPPAATRTGAPVAPAAQHLHARGP